MKLFYKPGACSLASHIALRESGLDFTLQSVDLAQKRLENGEDYLLINPKGQVPALLLDDDILLTVGSIARYQTLEWLNYVATELHKSFTPLFRPDTPEDYKPVARGLLEKKLQYVDAALADKQWLTGHRFTIADGYLFTVLRWAYAIKLDMAAYGHIGSWMTQVAARPAVAAALAAEGLK